MQRHLALDFIRGTAALGILVFHATMWRTGFENLGLGRFGVYMFFMLSAVTMAMVYRRAFEARIEAGPVLAFFRSRVARLLPLLALVSLYMAAQDLRSGQATIVSAGKSVLTGSGFFGLALPGFVATSPGSWSLGIEALFYCLVPVLLLLLGAASLRAIAVATAVLLVAQHLYLAALADVAPNAFSDYYTVPLTFAPFFAIGFLIERAAGERRQRFFLPMIAAFAAMALFSVLVAGDPAASHMSYLALTGLAALTIYFANRAEVPRVLRTLASFLGDISYSLYLLHPLVYGFFHRATTRLHLSAVVEITLFAMVSIMVAYASYRWFEKPARNYFGGRRREAAATLP